VFQLGKGTFLSTASMNPCSTGGIIKYQITKASAPAYFRFTHSSSAGGIRSRHFPKDFSERVFAAFSLDRAIARLCDKSPGAS
jgi:hypothetical protein